MDEESNRWNEGWFFIREDGTPLDPNLPEESLILLRKQIARAAEITREQQQKEEQRDRTHVTRATGEISRTEDAGPIDNATDVLTSRMDEGDTNGCHRYR